MPTILGHAVAATAVGRCVWPRQSSRLWLWTAVCAMLPDVDVVGFAMGIRYEDMLGHRGITHSLPFAIAVGFVVARLAPKAPLAVGNWPLGVGWVYFTAVIASHGVLDAFTNGGRGVAFFAPFSNHRCFFPWRPIQVSPIGVGFFSPRGLAVLASEARWIVLPSVIIALVAGMARAKRRV